MKYEVTRHGPPAEALGAYSGYRIRLVAERDAQGCRFASTAFYRGSESMPEIPVPTGGATFDSAADALEAGYRCAVEHIDRADARDAAAFGGDEPDPGTGHNG